MTTKKKESKAKETSTPKNDRFAEAREKRRLAFEGKNSKSNVDKSKEDFRKFFIKVKSKLGLDKDMEQVIWTHFKAYKFDNKDKFEEGIKHFGYKL